MVHCAVSAIRYESVSLSGIDARRHRTTSNFTHTRSTLRLTTNDSDTAAATDEIKDEESSVGSKSMWYGENLSLESLQIEEGYYSKEREYSPRAASSPSQPLSPQLDDSRVHPNEFSAHTPPASVDGAAADRLLCSSVSNGSSDDVVLSDDVLFDTGNPLPSLSLL